MRQIVRGAAPRAAPGGGYLPIVALCSKGVPMLMQEE